MASNPFGRVVRKRNCMSYPSSRVVFTKTYELPFKDIVVTYEKKQKETVWIGSQQKVATCTFTHLLLCRVFIRKAIQGAWSSEISDEFKKSKQLVNLQEEKKWQVKIRKYKRCLRSRKFLRDIHSGRYSWIYVSFHPRGMANKFHRFDKHFLDNRSALPNNFYHRILAHKCRCNRLFHRYTRRARRVNIFYTRRYRVDNDRLRIPRHIRKCNHQYDLRRFQLGMDYYRTR